jgi:uncharacterized RDD family membrane protein YckC
MELLDDKIDNDVVLEQASSGKRLANYVIDAIVFYVVIFGIAIFGGLLSSELVQSLEKIDPILDRLFSLVLYGIISGFIEGALGGKSLGKYLTGTRAVMEDGTKISFGTGLKRGFLRMIPFEQFTAFGTPCYPWHDRYSKTLVIDENFSKLNL